MKTTLVLGLVEVSLIALGGSCLVADPIQVLSLRNAAAPPCALANADSGVPIMSADGRFVLFASAADRL